MDMNSPEIQELLRTVIAAALPVAVAAALPGAIQQTNLQANQPPTATAFARTSAQANTDLLEE
jgi:hypothetical protein